MCGLVGLIAKDSVSPQIIERMVDSIKHRGPDESGFFVNENVGLGHARLTIIDVEHGKQPAFNEDQSLVIVFNGEIFNYLELREDLLKKGHVLQNNSDTAVLPHMYEEYGVQMFARLNGQFAVAIWDRQRKRLVLGRDRMGEKPLFYSHYGGTFCFASEIKALFRNNYVKPGLSAKALGHYFTYWALLDTETMFENVNALAPGSYLIFENGDLTIQQFWKFSYAGVVNRKLKTTDSYIEEVEDLLCSAVERRLMSDVPLACYLSGGLDSSLITAIASKRYKQQLKTFSITFKESEYDESKYQELVANHLGTEHCKMTYSVQEAPELMNEIVRHTECPFPRTSVFPLYKLAKFVKNRGFKVVLSGEGSDELFGGYTTYKMLKLKSFYHQHQGLGVSKALVPLLAMNGFDVVAETNIQTRGVMKGIAQILSYDIFKAMKEQETGELSLLEEFGAPDLYNWTPVQMAQYADIKNLLSGYTLSCEGDRITMASGLECRYPFLDPELIEFARTLPDSLKIRGLNEKYILKKVAAKYLPEEIFTRTKYPFYAPLDLQEFLANEKVSEYLSYQKLKDFGIFQAVAVEQMKKLIVHQTAKDKVKAWWYFLSILSTQVLYDELINKG